MSAPSSEAVHPHTGIARWTPNLIGLGVLLVAIGFVFRAPVGDAINVWWIYPAYSHCFLILPIAIWLVWERRNELAGQMPVATWKALWIAPLTLAVWWVGTFAAINEARQLAVIGFVQIAIWSMLGSQLYRRVLFPSLYLFFLVPMGEYLIEPLQRLTTVMVDFSLTMLAIPHFTQGTAIELTTGISEIAEACAGLRFLIATIALGTLFAYLSYRKWYKSVLFLIACIVVPIVGNGLRVLGIILLTHATNNRIGAGADHIVYGWGFNVAILLILMLIGSRFRDKDGDAEPPASNKDHPNPGLGVLSTVLVVLVVVTLGPATVAWHDGRPVRDNLAALTRPLEMPGLEVSRARSDWRPSYIGADSELAAQIDGIPSSESEPVMFYVEYYGRARPGHSLITHLNHEWDESTWQMVASEAATARLAGTPVKFREATLASATQSRLIWSTYWVGGRFTPSPFAVKLWQATGAVAGREGEAVLVLSTPIDSDVDAARARIAATLARLGDLPGRLNAASALSPSQLPK